MLNRTILVFYIDIGNLEQSDVAKYIERVQNTCSLKSNNKISKEEYDSVLEYFVPVRGDGKGTRIECINMPVFITNEEEKYKALLKIEKIDNKLDKITSQINASIESRKVITEKNG